MEGRIFAVAELLLLPFIVGIAPLCELALSLASAALQLVFGVSLQRPKESSDTKLKTPPSLIKWIQRSEADETLARVEFEAIPKRSQQTFEKNDKEDSKPLCYAYYP